MPCTRESEIPSKGGGSDSVCPGSRNGGIPDDWEWGNHLEVAVLGRDSDIRFDASHDGGDVKRNRGNDDLEKHGN